MHECRRRCDLELVATRSLRTNVPAARTIVRTRLSCTSANLVVIHFFWYTATGEIFKGNGYLRSVYQKKCVEIGFWITFGGSVIHALVLWITGGNPRVDVYGVLRSSDVSSGDANGLPFLVLSNCTVCSAS